MNTSKNKTIMVIDDEKDVVKYMTMLFEDNGYKVISNESAVGAMDMILETTPDLVTLDISMPEKSGIKFYRELRDGEKTKDIPIVVVTGVTGYAGKPESFEKFLATRKQVLPPDAFVEKPISKESLLETIEKLIN